MKQILLSLIAFYQLFLSPLMKQVLGTRSLCRYSPTCSTYAKEVIKKNGAIKGTGMAMRRFLSCQPFTQAYEYN